jgi:hypothetical protein
MTTSFIGPHEGRELELMLRGVKPLSMFVETIPAEFDIFPERDFDEAVSRGHLVKHVSIEATSIASRTEKKIRRVLYALPAEAWRIQALLLIQNLYSSLGGWRPDLDRAIGLLLGYERADVEKFAAAHER